MPFLLGKFAFQLTRMGAILFVGLLFILEERAHAIRSVMNAPLVSHSLSCHLQFFEPSFALLLAQINSPEFPLERTRELKERFERMKNRLHHFLIQEFGPSATVTRVSGLKEFENPKKAVFIPLLVEARDLVTDLGHEINFRSSSLLSHRRVRQYVALTRDRKLSVRETSKEIRNAIDGRLKIVPQSSNEGQRALLSGQLFEGVVADYIDRKYGGILGFSEKVRAKHPYEVDLRLATALIELTLLSKGKVSQLQNSYSSDEVNPHHLPVILFAPNYSATAATEALRLVNFPLLVARTKAELDRALILVQEGH